MSHVESSPHKLDVEWHTSNVVRIRGQELPDLHSHFIRERPEVAEPCDAITERRDCGIGLSNTPCPLKLLTGYFTLSKRLVPVGGGENCVLKSQAPLRIRLPGRQLPWAPLDAVDGRLYQDYYLYISCSDSSVPIRYNSHTILGPIRIMLVWFGIQWHMFRHEMHGYFDRFVDSDLPLCWWRKRAVQDR